MSKPKKKLKDEKLKPKVNKELDGFEIGVNSFGEIRSTVEIQVINNFLDRNLKDKKLRNIRGKKIKKTPGKSQ